MGALGTVTGFLDEWILDVLLKPSVSKLCVGVPSFGGGSGKGFLVGEAPALPAGFAGVPFGFDDSIVWDHITQEYGNQSFRRVSGYRSGRQMACAYIYCSAFAQAGPSCT